jgi:cytoskeleton protein RodZ
MKRKVWNVTGIAGLALLTGQTLIASQAPTSSTATSQPAGEMTITGCVQSEADYRKATGGGAGGVASTGIGAANEFILTNVMTGSSTTASSATGSSGATTGTTGGTTTSTTGTAGTAKSTTYELSGPGEAQAATHVGKRVEIVGRMKVGQAAGGGPTANVPLSRDLKLPEFEVTSVREASGSCAATR